jgi:prepilin-type N-terminal cleavage/methylation domain-containing protein
MMARGFRKGWTLIELMIAITIIGLLIGFMAPRLVGRVVNQARVTATRQQMDEIRKALVGDPNLIVDGELVAPGYHGDVGSWPPPAPGDTIGLSWLYRQPPGVPAYNPYTKHGWNGPYIRADSQLRYLDDSWQNAFRLIRDATGKPIGLESMGPDGVFGPPIPGGAVDDIRVLF